jgi:hypothetical protein
VLDMLGFAGDPVGKAEAALAADPGLALAHCLKAYAYLFALEPAFRERAAASIAAGEAAVGRLAAASASGCTWRRRAPGLKGTPGGRWTASTRC